MNAMVETDNVPATRIANAFGPVAAVSAPSGASANALMAREAQDIMVQTMAARNNPRDIVRAVDRIINAFTRPALCEDALYEYARGGTQVSGLSIRAAEVLAQNWGNMRSGVTELSRMNGQSEILVYAQDLETGFIDEKKFFVKHWRDTKQGGYAVTEERDIYEMVANMGARRKRACILTVIPKDVQDAARDQIDVTMSTTAEVTPDSIKKLQEGFAQFGVTREQIEKRIQRRIDVMLPAQMVTMRRIYASLRDGMSDVAAWFDASDNDASAGAGGAKPAANKTEAVKDALKAKAGGKSAEKPGGDAGAGPHAPNADSSIAMIRKATDLAMLAETYGTIVETYVRANVAVPVQVEGAYGDRKAALEQAQS